MLSKPKYFRTLMCFSWPCASCFQRLSQINMLTYYHSKMIIYLALPKGTGDGINLLFSLSFFLSPIVRWLKKKKSNVWHSDGVPSNCPRNSSLSTWFSSIPVQESFFTSHTPVSHCRFGPELWNSILTAEQI